MLNKSVPFVVRQAHHERNHPLPVRHETTNGIIQWPSSLSKDIANRFPREDSDHFARLSTKLFNLKTGRTPN
jgi:hypothetical protein